jgi:hypothetical protein
VYSVEVQLHYVAMRIMLMILLHCSQGMVIINC